MGDYLSTTITSPQTIAEGGVLTGLFTFTSPAAGYYYFIVEQYNSDLVLIPGSRAYLHSVGGIWVNSTVNYEVGVFPAANLASEDNQLELTLPNTDCYLYIFAKKILTVVPAGSLVAGNTYKILVVGTTNFMLVGSTSNVVGTEFVASGAGAGTGIVCTTPDPDVDESVDYVVITIQAPAAAVTVGIDISGLMNLMITMMIVTMMMKMMGGMMTNQ